MSIIKTWFYIRTLKPEPTKNDGVIIVRSLQLAISRFVIKWLSLAYRGSN